MPYRIAHYYLVLWAMKGGGTADVMLGQLASLRRVQNEKTHALIYFVVIAPSGSQEELEDGQATIQP